MTNAFYHRDGDMRQPGRLGIAVGASILALTMAPNGPAQSVRDVFAASLPACYRASYSQPKADIDSTMLPPLIELGAGRHSGVVQSAAAHIDSIGFWRMFLAGARWASVGRDSVQLNFTNGFSTIDFHLAIRGDSLEGKAAIYYDVIGRPIPRCMPSCIARNAALQSPLESDA